MPISTMNQASDVCTSMTQRSDIRVHEVAQSSFRQAYRLISCINSDQNQGRSNQEVSLIAQDAVKEFKTLHTLLDGFGHSCKRIRKGPLPNFHGIKLTELMDNPNSSSQNFVSGSKSAQPHIIQQFFPPIKPTVVFGNPWCDNKVRVAGNNLMTGLSLFSEQLKNTHTIHKYSSSEIMGSQNELKNISSKSNCGVKSEERSRRCVASTGGCHCSKRRKLRIMKRIRVPAVSNKLADIPPDDYSWRKYGQKPIKGSPHPRSYYKCSSMKGCPARKHVERCLEDSRMLVVTYEADHTHSILTFPPSNFML